MLGTQQIFSLKRIKMLIISGYFRTFISIWVLFSSIGSLCCNQSSISKRVHATTSLLYFRLLLGSPFPSDDRMIVAEGSISGSVRAPSAPSAFGRDLSLASGTLTHEHSSLSILLGIQWRLSAGMWSSLCAAFSSPGLENTVACVFPGSVSSTQGTHQ